MIEYFSFLIRIIINEFVPELILVMKTFVLLIF